MCWFRVEDSQVFFGGLVLCICMGPRALGDNTRLRVWHVVAECRNYADCAFQHEAMIDVDHFFVLPSASEGRCSLSRERSETYFLRSENFH